MAGSKKRKSVQFAEDEAEAGEDGKDGTEAPKGAGRTKAAHQPQGEGIAPHQPSSNHVDRHHSPHTQNFHP